MKAFKIFIKIIIYKKHHIKLLMQSLGAEDKDL